MTNISAPCHPKFRRTTAKVEGNALKLLPRIAARGGVWDNVWRRLRQKQRNCICQKPPGDTLLENQTVKEPYQNQNQNPLRHTIPVPIHTPLLLAIPRFWGAFLA